MTGYSDVNRRRDDFIAALMADMTLAEKIGQLNLVTPGGETLTGAIVNEGIAEKIRAGRVGSIFGVKTGSAARAFQMLAMEQRLQIPLMFAEDVIHGHRTIFPIPLALAASFDPGLIRRTARAAAVEASAGGIDQVYAPVVDVCRDPRWGRIAESPGEDPYLAARYAEAMVEGFQGDGLDRPDTVMACLKHFVGYGSPTAGRDYAGADMSAARLHEVFLPPFEAGVAAGAGSVMAGFNTLNGVPMHANRRLLEELLRGHLGFSGLVVADYTGVMELTEHRVAADGAEAARLSVTAGVDLDMVSELYLDTLEAQVRSGALPESAVTDCCRRVLEAKWRLGLFADPFRRIGRGTGTVVDPPAAHRDLAREAVAASLVLLKNAGGVLPLPRAGTVALIGPLADDRVNLNGTWAVNGRPDDAVTVRQGMDHIRGAAAVVYARGCDIVEDVELAARLNVHDQGALSVTRDTRGRAEMIAEAVHAAEAADVIVAVVGEAKEYSGESSSRTDLRLPDCQRDLLSALKATGKPLVVVVMTGRPLVLVEEAAMADALLVAWFGGTESGAGIAEVLFGDTDPGGRLPASFPRHEGQVPTAYDEPPTGRPFRGRFEKFRTGYLDFPAEVAPDVGLFPFGAGLSYAGFAYGSPVLDRERFDGPEDRLTVAAPVRNVSDRAGCTVVQLYIGGATAPVSRPRLRLAGIQKVVLGPGEQRTVTFEVRAADLAYAVGDDLARPATAPLTGSVDICVGPDSRTLQRTTVLLPEARVATRGVPA
jgi:beta-glucosidase